MNLSDRTTADLIIMTEVALIGLTALVALLETRWIRTGNPAYLRLTKFIGKLFIINLASSLSPGLSMILSMRNSELQ